MAVADIRHSTNPSPGATTLEEFLRITDEDAWVEWANGEVIALSPASNRHQDIADFLISILRPFVQRHDAGWVRTAPFLMLLPELDRAREPDLLFVRRENLDRVRETRVEGPADLVVEIISPESLARDRGEKFAEYEAAGVEEYWLIDPDRQQLEVQVLEAGEGETKRYRPIALESDGTIRSRVLEGFFLRPQWLFEPPLPDTLEVAAELGLLDR